MKRIKLIIIFLVLVVSFLLISCNKRETTYQDANKFSEGFASVEINGKYGFINTAGDLVIQPDFENARAFEYNTARVKSGTKWGLINKHGDFIVKPQFDKIGIYSEGFVPVEINSVWQYKKILN